MKVFSHSRLTLSAALFLACLTQIDCMGLSCYKCTIAPNPGVHYSSSQICRHFEENQHYQTYCPNSTLCMKKTIRHRLRNGTLVVTSVERGCAPQLHVSATYDFDKKVWNDMQKVVTSAYEERCFLDVDKGTPGGPAEYCFCSFNLCNGSITANLTHMLILNSLLLLLIAQSIIV